MIISTPKEISEFAKKLLGQYLTIAGGGTSISE